MVSKKKILKYVFLDLLKCEFSVSYLSLYAYMFFICVESRCELCVIRPKGLIHKLNSILLDIVTCLIYNIYPLYE